MKQLENAEEKQRVAKEIEELVNTINDVIKSAPPGLSVSFYQGMGIGRDTNSPLYLTINETVDYLPKTNINHVL